MSLQEFIKWQRIRSLGLHLVYFCLFILSVILKANNIIHIDYFLTILSITIIVFEFHSYLTFIKDKGKASYHFVLEIEELKNELENIKTSQDTILVSLGDILTILNKK